MLLIALSLVSLSLRGRQKPAVAISSRSSRSCHCAQPPYCHCAQFTIWRSQGAESDAAISSLISSTSFCNAKHIECLHISSVHAYRAAGISRSPRDPLPPIFIHRPFANYAFIPHPYKEVFVDNSPSSVEKNVCLWIKSRFSSVHNLLFHILTAKMPDFEKVIHKFHNQFSFIHNEKGQVIHRISGFLPPKIAKTRYFRF